MLLTDKYQAWSRWLGTRDLRGEDTCSYDRASETPINYNNNNK